MWGTSKQGTIPLSLLQEGGAATSSGGIFSSGDEKIVDHPMSLNLDQSALNSFLGIHNDESDEARNVNLETIFCGATGTAMVLNDGRCFVFGSNKNGELGIGQGRKETEKPIHVPLPDPVAKASLGPNFSAFLTTTGDLYTCGYGGSVVNGMGCLGQGNMESYHTPTLVNSLVEDGCYAADVQCGEYSMTVLTTEGEVLTCGSGSYGRLGNLETIDQLYLEPVEMIAGDDVIQIAGGFAFSLALNKGGIIHAWGRNNEGQLGTGMGLAVDMYAMESLPRPIEGNLEGRHVTRVAAGHTHAAAVTSNGELFTWGMNYVHEPRLETSLLHTKIIDVACGQNYTLALDKQGRVYSMGKGKTGVLGLASTKRSAYPVLVEGIPAEEKVVTMSAGYAHVACTTNM
jgi:alpha-tubulin suppressor-like RCC1 family protein